MIWFLAGCAVVSVLALLWALCRSAALGDAGPNDWLEISHEACGRGICAKPAGHPGECDY